MPTIVVLGSKPTSFKRTVSFTSLAGDELLIPCEFVYRTREEFGANVDAVFSTPDETPPPDGKYGAEFQQAQICRANARYLAKILTGWGLDIPLTADACLQLATEQPGGTQAVMDAYRKACTEGSLGN